MGIPYNGAPAQAIVQQGQRDDIINKILGNAQQQRAGDQQFVDQQLMPLFNTQKNAAGAANFLDQQALAGQQTARDRAVQTNNDLVNEQRGIAGGYNTASRGMYNDYATGQNALNTQDAGTLSKYMGETDPLMAQLQARGSNPQDIANQQAALSRATGIAGGSLSYQAALAQSNAQDVARQQGSYNTLNGIGGGSLDYTAAQYNSDPNDVARQETAYKDFQDIGYGSLDYQSQAARAHADPIDVANQRKALGDIQDDVKFGNKDQLDALNLIKSRTGTTATAEEALLAEQARRKFEGDDSSRRAAVLADQAQRGVRSGSAEIASMVAGQQQTAADRSLSEMALLANATQRAQAYTGMQANQSNAMRDAQLNALGLQGNMSTNMRNASFDEAYKRGVGADTASANNQNTRLSGYQYAGQQANAIRQANDYVGTFNVGEQNTAQANNQTTRLGGYQSAAQVASAMRDASDRMNISNAGFKNDASANNQRTMVQGAELQATQSNAIRTANDSQRQFEDMYSQAEATRVGNLAGDRAQTSLNTTNQIGQRNDTTHSAGQTMLDTNYGRDKDSISLASGSNKDQYVMDSDVNNTMAGVGANNYARAAGLTGTGVNIAGARSTASNPAGVNDALMLALGGNIFKEDENTIRRGY